MNSLFIHSDKLLYEAKQKTKFAEKIGKELKKKKIGKCLVCFMAFGEEDNDREKEVAEAFCREAEDIAKQVKEKTIVLYPYVHLLFGKKPSKPESALEIMKLAEQELKKKKFKAVRVPFGYYKAFELKCKGHPLSELSRVIAAGAASKEMEQRKQVKGKEKYLVLTREGKELEPEEYEFKEGDKEFKVLVEKEALKKGLKGTQEEPAYIKHLKKFQINWEAMSDKGHMRYGPQGTLIYSLIEDYSGQVVRELGIPVYFVKGTNMFNLNEKAVREHAELYGDRLYSLEIDKKGFVMRYAACHQQFAMIKDWTLSYKNLPFGAFEAADSYRLEQSGELLLAFRARRFNMPDLHVFCRDLKESKEWFLKLHEKIMEEIKQLGREYELLINFSSKKHFEQDKEFIQEILNSSNKNALLHFYPEGINYYWTVNIEYVIADCLDRPREIATIQIDIGNAERFGISYADEQGKKNYPVILHSAMIGSIERYLYAVFDSAMKHGAGEKQAMLQFWLCPTQARIAVVSEKYLEYANSLADELERNCIRADIDDRNESISRKVRDAELEWIPIVLVVGEREAAGEKLTARFRETGKQEQLGKEELIEFAKKQSSGKPFKQLPVPRLLSKRPKYA